MSGTFIAFFPLTLKEQKAGGTSAGSADGIHKHRLAFLILAWNPQELDQAGQHCVRRGRGGLLRDEVMPEKR